MEKLLNTLFPPKCIFCHKSTGSIFCGNCLEKVTRLEASTYFINTKTQHPLKVFSAFEYDGVVRECIKFSKYGARQFSALKTLTDLAVQYTYNLGKKFDNCVFVPIPLNRRKYRIRGFNQAELIAKKVALRYHGRVDENLLVRAKETKEQFRFSKEERLRNVEGAFEVGSRYQGNSEKEPVILVDDICTTGATLLEAAKTVKGAGYSMVSAFTLSRRS